MANTPPPPHNSFTCVPLCIGQRHARNQTNYNLGQKLVERPQKIANM